jgi:alkylhydroperoxidase family enzyme
MTSVPEAQQNEPRMKPLPIREWPPEMRAALAALTPPVARHPVPERGADRPKGLNALGVMAYYPELTHAFHVFNGHVLFGTSLTIRQRELMVLRISAVRGALYEWTQHKWMARNEAGMTDEEIERVAEGPDARGWGEEDRTLLRAVDELIAHARIGDETWSRLRAVLGEQQVMDLVFTVGAYDTLAMAFKTFGIQLDEDLTP